MSRDPHRRRSASELWKLAQEAGDHSRQAAAVRLCRRALQVVATDPTAGSEVHAQILVTLACYESELGRPDVGLSLLDEALHVDPKSSAAVWTARGLVLLKSGDKGALNALDQAVRMLSGVTADTARPGAGPSDLASALLNRGVLHMVGGRLAAAQRDTMAAEEAAREAGRPGVVLMARHNLGYVRFLAGALPEALDAMATATEMAPEAMQGVPALDRAKVLMSAGLLVSATQCTTPPLSSLTSNFRKQWGLAQNHSVTVPFRTSLFPVSNAELPWCANIGTDAITTPTARAQTVENLSFMDDLHVADRPLSS